MILSSLLLLLFIHNSFNLPAKVLMKRKTIEDTKANSKEEVTRTTPSTTIRSSIKSTKKNHTEDTKQPSSKAIPTVTPAKPIEHASNLPTPLRIQSVAPIKPMASVNDESVNLDPGHSEARSDTQQSDDDAGCIDICHNTEIHPAALPDDSIKQMLPSLPDMIEPLKNASCGDCCTWKCGKCNVTICKTSKPSCQQNNETCAQSLSSCQESKNKCAESSSCQESNNKCAESSQACNSAINPIVQKLTNCPITCAHAQPPCANNCPPEITCPQYLPPCIINCNNNYLGNNLAYGGEARYDGENNDGGNSFDDSAVRQPTTRKVSTIPPLASMKQFTENSRDSSSYNPIHAMPTQPVLGPEDLIVHHIGPIFIAQEYATQKPQEYMG